MFKKKNKETKDSQDRLYYPNNEIFQEYGQISDPLSYLSKSQFLFIRHGTSTANKFGKELKQLFTKELQGASN